MDSQMMWLATGWTVATTFAGGLAFLFWLLVREAGDGVRLLNENKESAREINRLNEALAQCRKDLREERYSLEATKRMALSSAAERNQKLQAAEDSFARQEVVMREALKKSEAELAEKQGIAKRVVEGLYEAIEERNRTVDKVIGENQTLRALLVEQADCARSASLTLSPSDDLLAMLSKIADEEQTKPCD